MPRSPHTVDLLCSEPECPNSIRGHRWGQIKAEGWFFSKDGVTRYCPDHIPDWVEAWREKQRKK